MLTTMFGIQNKTNTLVYLINLKELIARFPYDIRQKTYIDEYFI